MASTMVKKLLQIVCMLIFSACQCKGQVKADNNFVSFQGKLREYEIDSCLKEVLWKIVLADSAYLNYPPKTFFYELDFQTDEVGNKEITIVPSRWLRSAMLNYKGIIRIGGMSFLCKGDLIKAPLFNETNINVDVVLVRPKPYYYDSIDVKIEMFTRKPSLMGKYTLCKGEPIDLYILVGKKLEGFMINNTKDFRSRKMKRSLGKGVTNCRVSQNAHKVDDSNIKRTCQAFVKTICTKDTLAFYGLVDKQTLAQNLNQWIKSDKPISEEELYFPFFFVYSPLKISQKALLKNRNRETFFKEFKIDRLGPVSDTIVQVQLKWTENLPEATPSDIQLTLQGKNEWKVINAKWKTL